MKSRSKIPQDKKALTIPRVFTREGKTPWSFFDFDRRSARIMGADGEVVFEMKNVEVPNSWSQVATDILAQKYFRKTGVPLEGGGEGAENSIKQVAHRMAGFWKFWGEKAGYFATKKDAKIFYDEIVYTILAQIAAPNSPQWFNSGELGAAIWADNI